MLYQQLLPFLRDAWEWVVQHVDGVWACLLPILKVVWGWFLLFFRWEGAVLNWKLQGWSESAVFWVVLAGVLVELGFILAVFEGGLRSLRLARVWLRKKRLLPKKLGRIKLNGKGVRKPPKWMTKALAWMQSCEAGIVVRYLLIVFIAAIPGVPYLAYGSIALWKLTKSRYGYVAIVAGTIIKVFVAVHFTFHVL